jgi:hypothetical protein
MYDIHHTFSVRQVQQSASAVRLTGVLTPRKKCKRLVDHCGGCRFGDTVAHGEKGG